MYCSKCIFAETFDVSSNNITGTFDGLFCNTDNNRSAISVLGADCGGLDPKVDCSCCTLCCDAPTGNCTIDLPLACENAAEAMASGEIFGASSEVPTGDCDCTDDGTSFSCTDIVCESCSEDESVCGVNTDYGFRLGDDARFVSYTSSFQYTKGRNETVTLDASLETLDCSVRVDGQDCSACAWFLCLDDSLGLFVDCNNIIPGRSGLYDTCQGLHEEGGPFEVYNMYFTNSFTGCIPTLSPFDKLL